MQVKQIPGDGARQFVIVLDTGEEAAACLLDFAREHDLSGGEFTGLGAFRDVALGFFDIDTKNYAHIRAGTPVVGLEPACVGAFRDELLQMRPGDRQAEALSERTFLLSEFLRDEDFQPTRRDGRALVHPHCHHHAVLGTDAEIELLERTGLEVDLLDNGCCGMAGDYGFRRETYEVAMKVGERRFLPSVRAAGDASYVADGFSCREQARQATGRTLATLPEVLVGGG